MSSFVDAILDENQISTGIALCAQSSYFINILCLHSLNPCFEGTVPIKLKLAQKHMALKNKLNVAM